MKKLLFPFIALMAMFTFGFTNEGSSAPDDDEQVEKEKTEEEVDVPATEEQTDVVDETEKEENTQPAD